MPLGKKSNCGKRLNWVIGGCSSDEKFDRLASGGNFVLGRAMAGAFSHSLQRLQTSAPPKPHGHLRHSLTTAALQIADHYCVTLRVALEASGTVASGGQRPSMSGASKQCNGPGEHKSGRRIPPAKQQCRGAGYHSAMPMEQRPVGCPLAT